MTTRRGFLGQSAIALAAAPCLTPGRADALAPIPPTSDPIALAQDDDFWAGFRSQYELDPAWIVLSTVVRGVTTRAVRERAAAEAERLNRVTPRIVSDPEWFSRVRGKAARLIGAGPTEVALTRNTTDGITTVLLGWPLNPGDEILTSSGEHGHYYGTLAIRAARDRVGVRQFHLPTPAQSPAELVEAVVRALGPRTRLVLLCRVALTGQILPIREIAAAVHARGARLLVDGALSLGHVEHDVKAWDCDFFAGNFHKWAGGPRGTGIFYVRPDLVKTLMPLYGSVSQEGAVVSRHDAPSMEKFEEYGGHPDWQFYGLEAALDLLQQLGFDRIRARLFELTRHWTSRAAALPGFRAAVSIDPALAASLVAWEVAGVSSDDLTRRLARHRISLGGSDLYAGFFGIPANAPRWLVLTNTAVFTTRAELDRFVRALEREVAGE